MEKNPSYIILRIVLFADGNGFVLSKKPQSHDFYMTMQFVQEDGKLRCYRGGYHGNQMEAKRDFRRRVADYQREHGIRMTTILGLDIKRPRFHY